MSEMLEETINVDENASAEEIQNEEMQSGQPDSTEKKKKGRFISAVKKGFSKVAAAYKSFVQYMDEGSMGLVVISSVFSVLAIAYGYYEFIGVFPFVLFILAAVLSLGIEIGLVYVLIRFLFKGTSVIKVFFINMLVIFVGVAVAVGPNNQLAAVAFMIITALAFDIFGRCFVNTIKKRKYIPGYILLALSAVWIAAFFYVVFLPGLGENLIGKYAALEENAGYRAGLRINKSATDAETGEITKLSNEDIAKMMAEFDKSNKPGKYTPKSITYGVEPEDDIFSKTVNLTTIEKPSDYQQWKLDKEFGRDFRNAQISGKIWYPEELKDCPALFIVHGAHNYRTPSHLGYDYLGEYLASHGYVVVSIDENMINLHGRNSTRAVLFLENMKQVVKWNRTPTTKLYEKIDEANIVIAGHSRGGETVATAYLFNDYRCYPENADVEFDYHFLIKGVIAIAPTVDQYMPANRSVAISNVNYLMIHGSHDEDVRRAMGEKQYGNVSFKGDRDCFKSMVYIYGANHGQFNDQWGKHDMSLPLGYLNNVNNFISMDDQKELLKILVKNFMDVTLKNDDTYKSLFYDIDSYSGVLPKTAYLQTYEDSSLISFNNFEDNTDTKTSDDSAAVIEILNAVRWREGVRSVGLDGDRENHVLYIETKSFGDTYLNIYIPQMDLTTGRFTFAVGDNTLQNDTDFLDYTVKLTNADRMQISVDNPKKIMPSMKTELFKTDSLSGSAEYKHQLSTVMLDCTNFAEYEDFDMSCIKEISIIFHNNDSSIMIDNIGVYTEPMEDAEEWRKGL